MKFNRLLTYFCARFHSSFASNPVCSQMKTLLNILPPTRPHWVGDGFNVHPLFADMAFTKRVSPFLMLDYAAPKHFDPTSRKLGVGQHPHRGFETVTIAYQGEVEHGDHLGNHGVIGPGDVQWMTAASGIIHEEFHSRHFAKEGGVLEMVQLWVNLPAQYKMSPPRYQPILRSEIPVVSLPEGAGTVSVIAGEFNGVAGRASTFTPINMWDVRLKAGRTIEMSVPEGHNTIVLVRSGSVLVASDETHGNSTKSLKIGQAQIALFSLEGTGCTLKAAEAEDAEILLLSGEPIDEPIAARGPFVMNTEDELYQAMSDYQSGRLGRPFQSPSSSK